MPLGIQGRQLLTEVQALAPPLLECLWMEPTGFLWSAHQSWCLTEKHVVPFLSSQNGQASCGAVSKGP